MCPRRLLRIVPHRGASPPWNCRSPHSDRYSMPFGICAANDACMRKRFVRLSRIITIGALIPVFSIGIGAAHGAKSHTHIEPRVPVTASDSATRVQMQNVDFFVDPHVVLRIRHLSGSMRSKVGGPVMFDDRNTFAFNVENAEVGLTGPDLAALMNNYVFHYAGSPLSHLRINVGNGEIIQKGTLRKIASMPFEIHATISATPDGEIRIHPTKTEILGLHVDKLMHGLGIPLGKVIDLSKAKGASIRGNDIFLQPSEILPPPEIDGHVSSVTVEGDQVVMRFGSTSSRAAMSLPISAEKNYMYYRGGTLRFGKMMMLDADMMLTDLNPDDPFQFDLDRYKPQLVAGYSRTLQSGALVVWMRDVDRLGSSR